MSEPKKWMGLAALGAAIAGLVARLRHRSDAPSPPTTSDTPDSVPAQSAPAPTRQP